MRGSKDDLLEEEIKKNEKVFLSKKTIRTNLPKQKENPVKFLIQKPLLFKVENSTKNKNKENIIDGRWGKEEHDIFIKGLGIYGANWKKFKNIIKSRTLTQVRSHAQKFFLKMKSCKNENFGIDFTLNSIKHISDMINQIKNKDKNLDVEKIFNHLDNEYNLYEKNKKSNIKKTEQNVLKYSNKKNVKKANEFGNVNKFNIIRENNKNENIVDLENNFILNFMKENFIFDFSTEENEILDNNKELSLDEEENLPKQFFQEFINNMRFII